MSDDIEVSGVSTLKFIAREEDKAMSIKVIDLGYSKSKLTIQQQL